MEEFDLYPPKPELIEHKSKGSVALTFFSLVLFIVTFLFFFTDQANFIFQLLIVLIIHEAGHYSMMKLFKYKNVRMLFIPLMGAFVQGSKEEYSQKQSLMVIGAGPFPGIIIGAILMILASSYQEVWMVDLGMLFLFLNIINLIPLDPLDGGQLFKILLKNSQDLFLLIFSFISSLVLIGIGFYLDQWVLMAFGFIMGFRVRSLQSQYQLRKELKQDHVNYKTTYKLLSNQDFSKIKEVLLLNTPALRSYIDTVSPSVSEPLLASQVNNVLVSPVKRDASVFFKIFIIMMWIGALVLPIILILFFKEEILKNYEWYFKILSDR